MTVSFLPSAEKQFLKLDKAVQRRIQKYILELQELHDPRVRGKALIGNLEGLWSYRVGDYRIVCKIMDQQLVIFVVEIGHRREIYKD